MFYPPALVYLLLPVNWSLGLFNILHLFWGGLGAYWLAKRWTGHSFAAVLAGIGFAFNGLMMSTLMWSAIVAAHSWMPWIILANECAWRSGGRRMVYAIVAGSLQMLAGGPENILITWLMSTVFLGIACVQKSAKSFTYILRFTGIVAAIAVICSIQLLPFFEFLGLSQRGVDFADTASAVPGWGWANLILPSFYSAPVFHGLYVQKGYSIVLSYYAGIALTATALLAVLGRHKTLSWTLLGMLVLSLILCLGEDSPVYSLLKRSIPAIGFMRYPVKFLYPAALCIPLLASLAVSGIDRPGRRMHSRMWSLLAVSASFMALLLFLMWFCHRYSQDTLMADAWPSVFRQGIERGMILLLYAIGLSVWLICRDGSARIRACMEWLLVLLVWHDLDSHLMRKTPLVENWAYEPGYLDWTNKPTLGKNRALVVRDTEVSLFAAPYQSPLQEIVLKRKSLYGLLNLLEQMPKIRGNECLYLMRDDLVYRLFVDDHFPEKLADFLSISHYTRTEKPFDWITRTSYLPWVTVGQTAVFLDDNGAYDTICSERFDPIAQVVLPPEAKPWITATGVSGTKARVVATKLGLSSARIEVETDSPTMLTIAQSYHPRWQARIEGRPQRLWRANYAYQAMEIPTGKYQIDLFYRDNRFLLGSLAAFISVFGLFWLYGRCRMSCPSANGSEGIRTE
jgi:hypothetical protein